MTVGVSGAGTLARTAEEAAQALDDLAGVNRAAGRVALDGARIPRDTGRLDSSAGVAATADGFALTATAPYADAVHARDPFFTEAIARRTDAIADTYLDHVTGVVATIRGA